MTQAVNTSEKTTELNADFFAHEARIYGEKLTPFRQSAEQVHGFHELLSVHYPNLVFSVYQNEHARLVAYELPELMIDGLKTAYFGYWESDNHAQAARSLFEELEHDLASVGVEQMLGPINFSTFFDYRVQLNQFQRNTFPAEPNNPKYYSDLLQACGFELLETYFSIYTNSVTQPLQRLHRKVGRLLQRSDCHEFDIKPLADIDVTDYWEGLYNLIDSAFADALGYVPMSEVMFRHIFNNSSLQKFCAQTSVIALRNNQVVGLLLSLPDWGELPEDILIALEKSSASLCAETYFSQLKVKRAYVKTVCVLPELQNSGLYAFMFDAFLQRCQSRYEQVGGALMRQGNGANKLAFDLFDDKHAVRTDYGLFMKRLPSHTQPEVTGHE